MVKLVNFVICQTTAIQNSIHLLADLFIHQTFIYQILEKCDFTEHFLLYAIQTQYAIRNFGKGFIIVPMYVNQNKEV